MKQRRSRYEVLFACAHKVKQSVPYRAVRHTSRPKGTSLAKRLNVPARERFVAPKQKTDQKGRSSFGASDGTKFWLCQTFTARRPLRKASLALKGGGPTVRLVEGFARSTRLHTLFAKNSPPDCFLNAPSPLRVQVPSDTYKKIPKPNLKVCFGNLVRVTGLENRITKRF